jgi:hypothetical protein
MYPATASRAEPRLPEGGFKNVYCRIWKVYCRVAYAPLAYGREVVTYLKEISVIVSRQVSS